MKAWFIRVGLFVILAKFLTAAARRAGSGSSSSTVCLEVIGKVLEALAAHSLALLSSRLPSL